MPTYSLRVLIVRQWTLFAGCAAVLLCGGTLVTSYMVEDSMIDRKLAAVAAGLSDGSARKPSLPPAMHVYTNGDIPIDIGERAANLASREIAELRRTDGRYVHVMRLATNGTLSVLVYDVSDSMVVSSFWPSAIVIAAGVTGLFIIAAWIMANALAARIVRDTEQIAGQLDQISDPSQLREIAAHQRVSEIAHMLDIHADLWARQHALVDTERTNLAFLGHELRTPMQSAINAHALLFDSRHDEAAWERLSRALSRLQRANNAMLWMASGKRASADEPVALACVLSDLADELAPLAHWRDKEFDVRITSDPKRSVPREVIEVIFANLLRNGIDHAGDRRVGVTLSITELVVANTVNPKQRSLGFGIGLKIAQRLSEQSGWMLRFQNVAGVFVATLDFGNE
ncbi:MAG: HAMP domain-containing sensor histidine kinase [Sphingopyxis sp.]|uniref:sensor histidine kinase n=1 Tax=Sphingopyxis sp. TaxID=1908224 RepID=UPI002ABCB1AF|nr:HAMP domain-containing sensor histidine kinase [Sphingopyxis sp.]MDZ3833323.1 HAMP domain-containing sensor histidine kinase [Sphingopyxis sp.]